MYNVVRTCELNAHGVLSRTIKDAIGCCLLRLTSGMYSIIKRCARPRHAAIAAFITDESWLAQVIEQTDEHTGRKQFTLLDTIEKLRASSYPYYRVDDVVWSASAAYIHELPLYRPPRGKVHIAHPSVRGNSSDIKRSQTSIPGEDVVRIGKMTLTTPIRTAFDLIGQLGEAEGFAALESCLRTSVFGSVAGADEAARFGYPPDTMMMAEQRIAEEFMPVLNRLAKGRRRAERLLSAVGPLSESYAESRFVYTLMLLKLNGFRQQVRISDGNRVIARVDFAHEESKTIVFIDGVTKYADDGFRLMQKEAKQYNRLLDLGYRIVRLSFSEVTNLEETSTKLFRQAPQLRAYVSRGRSKSSKTATPVGHG